MTVVLHRLVLGILSILPAHCLLAAYARARNTRDLIWCGPIGNR
jgi:hypothetical protein